MRSGAADRLRGVTTIAIDDRAFTELLEPYREVLELHCYRMLGSLQDAEDLTQETLLRAWRSLERFQQRSSLHTWLYRIATNACLDELDRRPRRAQPVDPFPDHALPDEVDPAARYAAREGVELAFLTAIQQLPGRQRAVLILRDVLGWSGPEVAELLDTSLVAVNSALQRARDAIELPSGAPPGPSQRDLLERYVDAWERADIAGLVALLREDAEVRMPPQPAVVGHAAIADFFRHRPDGCGPGRTLLEPTSANGRPAVILRFPNGAPHGIVVLDIAGGEIVGMDAYIDPTLAARFH